MRDIVKRDLLATYIKDGFENDEDLDFYTQEFHGLNIPKKSFCAGHVSPFKFLCDAYFERAMFIFSFGSRTSGKTFIAAYLNHLNGNFRQIPIELLIAASVKDQANKGYNYFKQFHSGEFLSHLIVDSIQARTTLANGSKLEIVAGTPKGLNGPHAQKVCIDEVELIELPTIEQGLSISMSRGSVKAQDILLSTRKYANGTVSTLLEEQEERNLSVYSFCIWENLEKCTRLCQSDPEFGDCLAWKHCKGKAHSCEGWYSIADFVQKTANLSTKTFQTEWENRSPSGGKKVFDDHFDENIHVLSWLDGGRFRSFRSIFNEKEIPKSWRRIGGMDFGSNFGYLQIAIEPRYDIWIVFYEYFFSGDRLLEKHAAIIKDQASNPYWHRHLPIFADPSGKQGIIEMRNLGLNCYRAMNDIALGVDEVKRRMEIQSSNNLPKLFILDTCTELRRELKVWEHGMLPDGKPDLDSYEDGNDHILDCLRYMVFTFPRMPKTHVRPGRVVGIY